MPTNMHTPHNLIKHLASLTRNLPSPVIQALLFAGFFAVCLRGLAVPLIRDLLLPGFEVPPRDFRALPAGRAFAAAFPAQCRSRISQCAALKISGHLHANEVLMGLCGVVKESPAANFLGFSSAESPIW